MHTLCSNAIPDLPTTCCSAELEQVELLLDARTGALKRQPVRVVVGYAGLAAQVARLLSERGEAGVEVAVASEIDALVAPLGNYGQREVSAAPYLLGNAEWYDKPAPRSRHSSQFTKSQPSPKARKAARRRAKAGRKATR